MSQDSVHEDDLSVTNKMEQLFKQEPIKNNHEKQTLIRSVSRNLIC
jgi:hypothetical protein